MWASPGETGGRRVKASALTDAFVLGRVGLLVQLQLRLDVLCGEGDADLDAAGDAACNETQISAEGGGGRIWERVAEKSGATCRHFSWFGDFIVKRKQWCTEKKNVSLKIFGENVGMWRMSSVHVLDKQTGSCVNGFERVEECGRRRLKYSSLFYFLFCGANVKLWESGFFALGEIQSLISWIWKFESIEKCGKK